MHSFCLVLVLAVMTSGRAEEAKLLTPKESAAARKVYVAKCAKCHRFYDPTNYAEPDWRTWMEKMGRKSKLKPEQSALLNRYLDTYRAGRLSGKPEAEPKTSQ